MSKNISIHLVQLIHSLSTAEKRHFKLFASRNTHNPSLPKFVQLFNFIDKTKKCDDTIFLATHPEVKKIQLPNIKSHLYKQLLISLRLQHAGHYPIMEIRELIDSAYILYTKGLHASALRIIEKAKSTAEIANDRVLLLEIIEFEKKIESHHLSRGFKNRAAHLVEISVRLGAQVAKSVDYSNLILELYGLYTKVGVVRNERDYHVIKAMFEDKLPDFEPDELGFNEKLMLYNAYEWYYLIIQDFLMSYRYSQRWVDLFETEPKMKIIEQEMYIRGMHNLLLALFHVRNYERFCYTLTQLEEFQIDTNQGENLIAQYELTLYTAKINKHYLEGSFSNGVELEKGIKQLVDEYSHILDEHRIMVLNYKLGCMFFGAGMNKEAIKYLNRVIQSKAQAWREDIQSFARILNLIAHYELGNDILVEYQVKSVYRFLLKMNDMNGVQVEILNFLRKLPLTTEKEQQFVFHELLRKLTALSHNRFEKRPFLYLDIISWLESKIHGKTVQEVVQEKFNEERRTGKRLYFPVKKS